MAKMDELAARLREKQKKAKRQEIDWDKRKTEWIHQLWELFSSIEQWLSPLVKENLANISRAEFSITEEFMGTYESPSITIQFPDNPIQLRPVGRNIIGARGRVDVISMRKRAMLLLHEDGWKIAIKEQQGFDYKMLDEEAFADLLDAFTA